MWRNMYAEFFWLRVGSSAVWLVMSPWVIRNAGILLATPVALSSMQLTAIPCFGFVVTPWRKIQVTSAIKKGRERWFLKWTRDWSRTTWKRLSNFLSCSTKTMECLSGRTLSAKSTLISLRAVLTGGVSNETFKSW